MFATATSPRTFATTVNVLLVLYLTLDDRLPAARPSVRQNLHDRPHHGAAMSVTGSSVTGGVLHQKCRTRWVEHETHAD